jgi:hypothetical protein
MYAYLQCHVHRTQVCCPRRWTRKAASETGLSCVAPYIHTLPDSRLLMMIPAISQALARTRVIPGQHSQEHGRVICWVLAVTHKNMVTCASLAWCSPSNVWCMCPPIPTQSSMFAVCVGPPPLVLGMSCEPGLESLPACLSACLPACLGFWLNRHSKL